MRKSAGCSGKSAGKTEKAVKYAPIPAYSKGGGAFMERIISIATEKEVFGDDEVRASVSLPVLPEKAEIPLAKSFSAYYGRMRKGFMRFAGRELLSMAKGGEVPAGAVLKAVVSSENADAASVYVDAVVTVKGRKYLHRLPQLWDKKSGTLAAAKSLFSRKAASVLFPLVEEGVVKRAESAGISLYSDWKIIAKRRFDIRRFYLSPRGAVFFYPAETLNERNEVFPVHISAGELKSAVAASAFERLWPDIETESCAAEQ